MTENEKNFAFSHETSSCTSSCPLAHIPESVWRHWLVPPFRKRHPWIFRLLLILGVLLLLGILLYDDEDSFGDERIALVEISGPILSITEQLDWLQKISRNPKIKGVLVRIDSPGGGAAASQELYNELKALGKKKTIAVSMGSTAASGGVMVAMAGERIFANASTVTGSIGVRMDIPQLGALMDKIGVGQETLTTAPFKDAGSVLRPLTPEQRAYFQDVLSDMHKQFIAIVAEGRKMPYEKAEALATGKIFTGKEAQRLGLVDELGGQQAALQWLAQEVGVSPTHKLAKQPKETDWLARHFTSMLGIDVRALAPALHSNGTPVFLYQM